MSNDRLKFRAWDGKSIRYDVTGFEHGRHNEMAGVFLDGDYFAIVDSISDCDEYNPGAVVMQWAGLYDSEGVEAYQGDIVCQSGHPGDGWPWGNMAVEWDDEDACFCLRNRNGKYGTYLDFEDARCFKLIGDIYQNPELLENPDD